MRTSITPDAEQAPQTGHMLPSTAGRLDGRAQATQYSSRHSSAQSISSVSGTSVVSASAGELEAEFREAHAALLMHRQDLKAIKARTREINAETHTVVARRKRIESATQRTLQEIQLATSEAEKAKSELEKQKAAMAESDQRGTELLVRLQQLTSLQQNLTLLLDGSWPSSSSSTPQAHEHLARHTHRVSMGICSPFTLEWQPLTPSEKISCSMAYKRAASHPGGLEFDAAVQLVQKGLQGFDVDIRALVYLADRDGNMRISELEFCLMLYLMKQLRLGATLPACLAESQVDAIVNGAAEPGAPSLNSLGNEIDTSQSGISTRPSTFSTKAAYLPAHSCAQSSSSGDAFFFSDAQEQSQPFGVMDTPATVQQENMNSAWGTGELVVGRRRTSQPGHSRALSAEAKSPHPWSEHRALPSCDRPEIRQALSDVPAAPRRVASAPPKRPNDRRLRVFIDKVSLDGSRSLESPFFSVSIRGSSGALQTPLHDTEAAIQRVNHYIIFQHSVVLALPTLEQIKGSALFFELKHWKPKAHKVSLKAWSAVPLEALLREDSEMGLCQVRTGSLSLPLYQKPLDPLRTQCKRINPRSYDLHVTTGPP
mmetsp:Transcript_34215/g.96991  ORF Transcript_34215/g.96991 Transcript_34215/m.96991 type:complete len:598 (-) Transcript_34215:108-1901(-)|eukprot:CAMPEP_0117665854 /NCGR_PEP_ID=MMETSP0804-20121206/10043_1 /TAXON_ID=1074897 /ORGANISM="Tetraselmis astigmatica, Strain CCMP880" /LENGTH=597 /DNA_ID=CAMNT_0005473317 /DNA_START=453 /DNA_END=2246 /DNA_ORIENTATION=+